MIPRLNWPDEIKKLCESRGWSVRQLAADFGMNHTFIQDVANGKRPASPILKLRIIDRKGYDLGRDEILELLLSTDVAEEFLKWDKQRSKKRVEKLETKNDKKNK